MTQRVVASQCHNQLMMVAGGGGQGGKDGVTHTKKQNTNKGNATRYKGNNSFKRGQYKQRQYNLKLGHQGSE